MTMKWRRDISVSRCLALSCRDQDAIIVLHVRSVRQRAIWLPSHEEIPEELGAPARIYQASSVAQNRILIHHGDIWNTSHSATTTAGVLTTGTIKRLLDARNFLATALR